MVFDKVVLVKCLFAQLLQISTCATSWKQKLVIFCRKILIAFETAVRGWRSTFTALTFVFKNISAFF